MDIHIKSVCEGMDICVTCSSVCRELELELLTEDTITVLRRLLHDFDLDSCFKILRPNKKLSLCEACHETLKNASLFRNKALESLRELEKEWCRNQLQQNTQSTSVVENTLTFETIDIKVEIDPYPETELNSPGILQSSIFSHQIKNEYDSDYALSEFHSMSSENETVPKEGMIETDLLDCEEKIGSTLLRKGSMNLGLGSKKLRVKPGSKEDSQDLVDLNLIVPIFETSHRTQASKASQQLKSKPVKKVGVKEVDKNKSTRIKPVKIIEKTLPARDQTMILTETESECESDQGETDGEPIRGRQRIRKKWYITVLTREQLIQKREERLKDSKYINAVHKCEYCAVPFDEQSFHYYHEQACNAKKTEDGVFSCFCGCSFAALPHLTAHARFHSVGRHTFQCSTCPFTTADNYLVARHKCPNKGGETVPPKDPTMVLTKARRQYYCPDCDYMSHHRPVDSHYMRFHKNDCQMKCEQCGKILRNHFTYKNHVLNVHENPKPKPKPEEREVVMFCAPCERPFYTMADYRSHMQTLKHTPKDQITLQCDECPKKFHLKLLLERHKKTHELERTGEKPHKCKECGDAYLHRSGLRSHIRSKHKPVGQDDARNHICHVCGSTFTNGVILRGHMAKHSDERPYKCEYCGDTFKFPAARYTHVKLKHKKNETKSDDGNKGASKTARSRKRKIEKGDDH